MPFRSTEKNAKTLLHVLAAVIACASLVGCNSKNDNSDKIDTDVRENESTNQQLETVSEEVSALVGKTNIVTIGEDVLRDKIAGSWVAQMVGVTWGASTEFTSNGKIIPEKAVPKWRSSMVNDAFGQDDLFVEIPFIDAMKDNGIDCSVDVFGEYFKNSTFWLAHANHVGRENLRAGIPASEAGHYKNSYHADDIDWQIEADFLGNIYPGMVNKAAERAFEIGHLMNYGDGVYGGVYVAAMHSSAMVAETLGEVLEAGRNAIPEGTKFRSVIDDVENSYKNGDSWEECWQKLEDKWADGDKCPECAGKMNIDAKLNAAYIHMGLLWGEGDFTKTMEISMRCGQDSDCNPSSSAAVLGTFYGLSALPEEYMRDTDYDSMKFYATEYTLNDCIDISLELMKKAIEDGGGVKDGGGWKIVTDTEITPVKFEQWPDDELCVYLTVSTRSEGRVNMTLNYVLPADAADMKDKAEITFDMGDGTVIPMNVSGYTYSRDGEYTITATVKLPDSRSAEIKKQVKIEGSMSQKGFKTTPSCSVDSPAGGGSRNIGVICDGGIPRDGDVLTTQYDTYTGQRQDTAWFALEFDHDVTVSEMYFTEGAHMADGGWFRKVPAVEALIDGEWQIVPASCSPLYIEVDSMSAQGNMYETFTFTLDSPTECRGVRITGEPGGSATFASCSELDIAYTDVKDPTYTGEGAVESAVPFISVTAPAGVGSRDIEIIRDGIIPKKGADNSSQYDTYVGAAEDKEDYFGYIFRGEYKVVSVSYTDGVHFPNGGWFKDGDIRLEVLKNGEWVKADTSCSPEYPNSDKQAKFKDYKTYVFTLDEITECSGVRIIGSAGGEAHFVSVSELSVETAE